MQENLLLPLILHYGKECEKHTISLVKEISKQLFVVVIDNGSETPIDLDEIENCMVISTNENLGFTKGWNTALKIFMDEQLKDKYKYFWLLNNDIEISSEAIERVIFDCESNLYDIFTLSYNSVYKHCNLADNEIKGTKEVDWIEFTAPIISRNVIEKIGLFDDTFIEGYGVELDYCHRTRQHNAFKIHVDTLQSFNHIGQQTINSTVGLLPYSYNGMRTLNMRLINKYGANYNEILFNGKHDKLIKSIFMNKIAVYTTIFGNYDSLKDYPAQSLGADFFLITDNPSIQHKDWKTIVVTDKPTNIEHPRMKAKFYKIFPYEIKELTKYEYIIFIDASIQINTPDFVQYCFDTLGVNDIALFKHPERDCIFEEVKASRTLGKYDNQPLEAQVEAYKDLYVPKSGLYACGVMIRKITPIIKTLMGAWWWENVIWSYQDQLSFPVVCNIVGVKPITFNHNQYSCPHFTVLWNAKKSHL